jgi:hypothetical protein
MNLQTFKQKLDNCKIIIYGAGKMGQQLAACLKNIDSNLTPTYYAITNGEESILNNIIIKQIDKIEETSECIILIATGRTFHVEIIKKLDELNIKKHLIVNNELLDNLKRESIQIMFQNIGIDFNLLKAMTNDFLSSSLMFNDESYNGSIRKKMFDLALTESAQFAMDHMTSAVSFDNCWQYRKWTIQQSNIKGLNLEFGVADGSSLDFFSKIKTGEIFYGFDSFEGLPETWKIGFEKGRFSQINLPPVPSNVELIKGWFEDSIPNFKISNNITSNPISFLHIDCDLYSSTKTIFHNFANNIVAGTIIAFDEYFNYPSWQIHEHKAFMEFVNIFNVKFDYISYVENGNQVAIRINSIGK